MNGDNAAPLYKYLKSAKGGMFGDSIKWNFSKFLVDKEGNVVERYAPTTSPLAIEVKIFTLIIWKLFHKFYWQYSGFSILFAEGCKETVGGCMIQQ